MLLKFTSHSCVLFSAQSVSAGNCSDGEVRLVGGANITLGVVEVCINNAWGTVCKSGFGTNEAKVVCHQLQFNPGNLIKSILYNHYYNIIILTKIALIDMTLIKDVSLFEFPPIKTPIFMENLDCESNEISLIECPHHVLHQCDHSQDAAVQCYG